MMRDEHRIQAKMNEQTRLLKATRDAYEKDVDEAKVEPGRWFKSQPTWAKILSAITIGIGAAAQGYMQGMRGIGGGPPIIGLVQDINKQDIEDQKSQYEMLVQKGQRADNEYLRAMELWGDPELAELQMEKDKLTLAQGWLQTQAQARGQADQLQANYMQAANDMNQRIMELDESLGMQGQARIVDNLQALPKMRTGGGRVGGGAVKRENVVRLPDGRVMFAPDGQTAKKVNEGMAAAGGALSKIAQLRRVATESNAAERALGVGDAATAESLTNQLLLDIKKAENLGALDQGAVEVGKGILGGASDLWRPGWEKKLDAYEKTVREGVQRNASQFLSEDPDGTILPSQPVGTR
jgi:hypothetical protein